MLDSHAMLLVGEDEPWLRVLQYVRDALIWIRRIDGHVGGSCLEHRQDRDQHAFAAIETQRDELVGANAPRAEEMMRQLIGALVQLSVAELHLLVHHCDAIWGALDLRLEQRVNGFVGWERVLGAVALVHQIVQLARDSSDSVFSGCSS